MITDILAPHLSFNYSFVHLISTEGIPKNITYSAVDYISVSNTVTSNGYQANESVVYSVL